MITIITEGIEWNHDNPVNAEARAWIAEHVMATEPETDVYGRPEKWTLETDTATVTVTREYIKPVQWGKKRDLITVEPKGGER